jgi:hypothetical protein
MSRRFLPVTWSMTLLADYNLPFAVALALMVLLAAVQLLGLGGISIDADSDVDGDLDADGAANGLVSLLGIGRVPLMIWLALFLLCFAAIGVSGQALADSLLGTPLDKWLAALLAGGAALPVTGALVRPLARILPQDESTAVGLDSLLGRRGTVTTGRAAAGSPARTHVLDRHGHPHFVMLEPHEAHLVIEEGDDVLLVRRDDNLFFGVPLQERVLAPLD